MERSKKRAPTHPAAILREFTLPELNITKTEFARLLGISRETLYRLLREEQGVTAELAAKIGKLCGNGPGLWLRLQADYDTHKALSIDVSHIPNLNKAA